MPKYKITATEDIFGGRSSVQIRIPDGPTRVLTAGEPKVDLTLTPEQAKSVEQAGYEVSPSPLAEKVKAAKAPASSKSSTPKSSAASTPAASTSASSTPASKPSAPSDTKDKES